MSDTEKLDVQFHFQRRGKNKVLVEGKEPPKRKRTRPGKELLELRRAVVCWVC